MSVAGCSLLSSFFEDSAASEIYTLSVNDPFGSGGGVSSCNRGGECDPAIGGGGCYPAIGGGGGSNQDMGGGAASHTRG